MVTLIPQKKSYPMLFLRGADCWGWATWRRGWKYFNSNGKELHQELENRNLVKSFNYNGASPFFRMLLDQISGKIDSWAIRWHASAFLAGKFTLYPGKSLIHNIGLDSSGTNCESVKTYDVILGEAKICFEDLVIEESSEARVAFTNFFKRNISLGFWANIKHQIIKALRFT